MLTPIVSHKWHCRIVSRKIVESVELTNDNWKNVVDVNFENGYAYGQSDDAYMELIVENVESTTRSLDVCLCLTLNEYVFV